MNPSKNYFNQSMNEIVFESKNKDYGAFLLRQLYKKNLTRALCLTLGIFILGSATPAIINYFGFFNHEDPLILQTTVFELHAPPSINPLQAPKPPPPKIDEVKRPTEKFMELEAAQHDDLNETPPPIKDLLNKDIGRVKKDTILPDNSDASKTNTGSGQNGNNKVWDKVEQPPEFIGGDEAYSQFMMDNMAYPREAKSKRLQGITKIYFVVNKDGYIEQVKVLKSSGSDILDEEAMRLIKIQPKYKPGKQNGVNVKAGFVVEIEFVLPK